MKNDFEVTGEYLDAIVESARETDGVLAARMTGAGFGGCAICIVENDKIEEIKESVGIKYLKKTGIKSDFYTFDIDDGARKLK